MVDEFMVRWFGYDALCTGARQISTLLGGKGVAKSARLPANQPFGFPPACVAG
jgi:hypothetical protein